MNHKKTYYYVFFNNKSGAFLSINKMQDVGELGANLEYVKHLCQGLRI